MLRRTSLLLSIVLVVHFSFLCFIQPVNARTTTVPDGSSKTIQDAVDQAAPGDTILIPAGEYTFTKPVNVTKPVIIKGAGVASTAINMGSTACFYIYSDNVKIEGIKFVGRSNTTDDRAIDIGNVKDFCVKNCEFYNISRAGVVITGKDARGVISNSVFIDIYKGSGVVIYGGGAGNWSQSLEQIMGTENAVFVEKCDFLRNWHAIASNDGSKYVFRYNTVDDCLDQAQAVDAHGPEYGSSRGSRSYEIYGNTIKNENLGPNYAGIWIRGGDGVIYDNQVFDCSNGILLSYTSTTEEEEYEAFEYPEPDQTEKLYAWNNQLNGVDCGVNLRYTTARLFKVYDPSGTGPFQVYLEEMPGYSPYTYPHPLTDDSAWQAPPPAEWKSKSDFSGVEDLGDKNTGSILARFDMEIYKDDSECIVGYANHGASVTNEDDLFVKIRAHKDDNNNRVYEASSWDADSGYSYDSVETVSYSVYSNNFVEILLNFDTKTYSAWVTTQDGGKKNLADGYKMGSQAANLGQVCLKSDADNDFSVREHTVVSYTPKPEIICDKYSASVFEVDGQQREDALYTFGPYDGEVEIEFDFVPFAAPINGVVGFAGPDTKIEGFVNFSFMFRAYTNGLFDSYKENTYTYANKIPYSAYEIYQVRMVVDMGAETYNAWVTTPEGDTIQLASDYTFRAATDPRITELGKAFLKTVNEGEFGIRNFTVKRIGEGSLTRFALGGAIAKAQKLIGSDYTTESWADLVLALEEALETKADENASSDEIADAILNLRAAINALVEIEDIVIGPETSGGAGKVRTITISSRITCDWLVVQFTEGTGANAKISVIMVSPVGNTVTVSYPKAGTRIDVWAASGGIPDLTGEDMGVEITGYASTGQ